MYHFITTLQHKGYSGSDGTMVGDKYTWLALLAGFLLLCPYSCPAVLQEVGEVVYSLTENKMNISTYPRPPLVKYFQPPISSSRLTYLSINKNKNRLNCFSSSFTQWLARNLFPTTELYNKQLPKPLNSQHSACTQIHSINVTLM